MGQNILRKSDTKKPTSHPDLATAEKLKELLKICPHCRRELASHDYALFATSVLPKKNSDPNAFVQALENHDWPNLRAYQSWDAVSDNIECYVLRCPQGNLAIALVLAALELLLGSTFIRCDVLSMSESERFITMFPSLEWRTL